MWYVMQTQAGTESELCGKCQSQVAREDEEVFVLLAERMTKKQGKWSMVTGRLFPGYVFVETGRIEDFYKRLKGTGWTARILRTGEEITPVYPEEEAYLKQLGGREHIVRYSEGYIEGDKLTVTSGAMKGCQGEVKKVLRHKRLVVMEIPLMGKQVEVTVGMGIVSRAGAARVEQVEGSNYLRRKRHKKE